MFYLRYIAAELRRRKARTLLTSLGLAVGVGLVVIVGALSQGLDNAQDKVLEPLTGVALDLHPIGCSRAPTSCLCTGRNGSGQVALPRVVASEHLVGTALGRPRS